MFSLLLLVFSLFGSQAHGMFAAGGVVASAMLLNKGLLAGLRSHIGVEAANHGTTVKNFLIQIR